MTRLLFRSAGFGLFSDFAPWSFSSPGRLRPIRPPCPSAGSVRLCWFRSAGSASTSPLPGPRHRPSASPLGASPFSPRCCGGVHLGPRGVAVFREPADPPAAPPDLHPCRPERRRSPLARRRAVELSDSRRGHPRSAAGPLRHGGGTRRVDPRPHNRHLRDVFAQNRQAPLCRPPAAVAVDFRERRTRSSRSARKRPGRGRQPGQARFSRDHEHTKSARR